MRTLSIVLLVLSQSLQVFAQAQPVPPTQFVPVASDDNAVPKPEQEKNTFNENIAIIDGNQSLGSLSFAVAPTFSGVKAPRAAYLLVNVAELPDTESEQGFSVLIGDRVVGKASRVPRTGLVETQLDLAALKGKVTLTIKANGDDGLYLYRVRSGLGPVLKITY
jgi:hypothetical protein